MTSIEAFTREHGLGRWLNQLLEMGDDRDELSEGLTGDEFEHFVESCGMPAPDAGIYRRLPARTARPPICASSVHVRCVRVTSELDLTRCLPRSHRRSRPPRPP